MKDTGAIAAGVCRRLAVGLVLLFDSAASAQEAPEGHAGHHGGSSQAAQPAQGPMEDMMKGMEAAAGAMTRMGPPEPRPLFPSLMDLPDLPADRRAAIQRQARERMGSGAALVSEGLGRLERAGDDVAAKQAASDRMREGLGQFESGLAAARALAEGGSTRQSALGWFKRQMDLPTPDEASADAGPFGLSWFHFFAMALLIAFSAAMAAMYFVRMRRAALLLQGLTGSAQPAAGGVPGSRPPTDAHPQGPPPAPAAAGAAPGPASRRWSGKLRLAHVFEEAPDVKTFRLMNPLGGVLPFNFLPGQFLTLAVGPEGEVVKRSYTIASSPTQHDYAEITVKLKEPGVVSSYLHDRARAGDLWDVTAPSGSFIFTGREAESVVLIGGGVGITPLMSVVRYLTDRSWSGEIFLLYSIRSPDDFIFRQELAYLERRFSTLRTVVIVSKPQGTDWAGPTGRITKELLARTVSEIAVRRVHICGPVPMMEAVKGMLIELGVPKESVKTEAFGSALGRPAPKPASASQASATGAVVTFTRSEKAAPLPADTPVLDVADEIGVEIDNSCRIGVCGLCRVKLVSGSVTMAVEEGLEPGDKEQGIVLACQAKSAGAVGVEA